MSLNGAITNLASWAGNTIMPTMAGMFFAGAVVGTIEDTPGVHGIVIAGKLKHGFTSNGKEDRVSMFDTERGRKNNFTDWAR